MAKILYVIQNKKQYTVIVYSQKMKYLNKYFCTVNLSKR